LGLRKVVEAKDSIPWADAISIALSALQAGEDATHEAKTADTTQDDVSTDNSQPAMVVSEAPQGNATQEDGAGWHIVVSTASEFILTGCQHNQIPDELRELVWQFATAAIRSSVTWADSWDSSKSGSFSEVLLAAYNTAGGDATRMLMEIALWDYRHHAANRVEMEPRIPEVEARFVPLVEHVLSLQGQTPTAARVILGHFVPQLYLLAPEWMEVSEEQVFGSGTEDILGNPIWCAYVTRSRLYDSTYHRLRRWYVQSADALATGRLGVGNDNDQDSEWSVTKGLALHILVAVIRGLANIGDEDGLVEKTFSYLPIKHRVNSYWNVFRNWSEADEPVAQEFAERLVAFWEWRLVDLEHTPESPARSEEAAGLMWFLMTPFTAPSEAIRLGRRTIALNTANEHIGRNAWERLSELAKIDAVGTFELVELLVEHELGADYAYLRFEDVGPPLRAALHCTDPTICMRAERLIHMLGERGHLEFGKLLSHNDL